VSLPPSQQLARRSPAGRSPDDADAFTVSGSHTYAEDGTFRVTVAMTDRAPGTASASADSFANVAEAALSLTNTTINATEGSSFSGTVATINEANPLALASDYSVSVNWGDGSPPDSTGAGTVTLVGSAGVFNIRGTHTYADDGTYSITVSVIDDPAFEGPSPPPTVTTSTAVVAEADLTTTGATITPTEGLSFTGTVATFTDPGSGDPGGDFTASINWGDGTSSAGTVTAIIVGGGEFSFIDHYEVAGTHTYAEEGNFTVTTTISEPGTPGTFTATGAARVADAPLTAAGRNLSANDTAPFNGVVATFTDADPAGTIGDYTATINWGDGTTTAGVIGAGFSVSGSHFYDFPGTFTVHTTIRDVGGSVASADSPIAVAAGPAQGPGVPVEGLELTPLTGVPVAVFTSGRGVKPASVFSATIFWGDGAASPGAVAQTGTQYVVTGSHTYADEGVYAIDVRVADLGAVADIADRALIHEEQLPPGFGRTPSQLFVSEVYRDLLGRGVDPSGLAHWSAQLDAGVSRLQVVLNIQNSTTREFYANEADGLFVRYLHRHADAAGLINSVLFMEGGGTGLQLAQFLLGSPEYFVARAGGTAKGFMQALYADALGRPVDAASLAAGAQAFAQFGPGVRGAIAAIVLNGREYRQDVAVDLFGRYFDRAPSAGELSAVLGAQAAGVGDEMLVAVLLAQDEVFGKANI
jgi:hypothetical protein